MADAPDTSSAPSRQHPLQDALARLLGIPIDGRTAIVRDMFTRHRSDAVSYWLQLVLATGIATLGLVLSSTGIVIGAMLISPLMSPIVGLGMGLAVGAPLLTLRSMFRVAASIVWVMGLAAMLTIGLPFHETTSEIAARTSPTLLDLVVAAFCALAAGFTTARHTDTTSTAAGTAIGISLVPPLCVAGYGVGVGQWTITGGALLLFTANFCAIIFCSALLFVGLGFNHVLLTEADAPTGVGVRAARRLRALFGARYGVMWRLVLPTLLLASVYVPLRAALGEVAWKIQVRDAVTRVLHELAPDGLSVRTSLTVEPDVVRIHLALIGSHEEARDIEDKLRVRVAALAGIEPVVDVTAVPDDRALQRIAESVATPRPPLVPVVPPVPLTNVRRPIADVLAAHWPAASGQVRRWQVEFTDDKATTLHIDHTGPALGGAAESLLGDIFRSALGEPLTVHAYALPTGKWTADDGITPEFMPHLARGLAVAQTQDMRACVTRALTAPPADAAGAGTTANIAPKRVAAPPSDAAGAGTTANTDPKRATAPFPADLAQAAEALLVSLAGPRVEVRDGTVWAIELVVDACPPQVAPQPAIVDPLAADRPASE